MNWGSDPYEWVGDWSGRRASLSPDRTAVIDETEGEAYTYADLDDRANATARLLESVGVDEGERVAVVSRNRVEAFDLFFATGKLGAILAPLSYRLAPPELAELLDLVEPRLLVIESPFVERIEHALARADVDPIVFELAADEIAGGWDLYADRVPDDGSPVETAERSLSDPHLLLHTGGSTGTPKETTITHGSIYWNSFNTITAWGLRPDDVAPMVFPIFHTGGWNVLTLPFFNMGGTLIIDREVEPDRVLEQIDRHGATVLVAVPAVLRTMARHDGWERADLSTLRFVKSGGGPCRDAIVRAWRNRGVEFSQGYGLTECGPNNFAMPDEWANEKVASVGKPVMHTDVRVVDDDGRVLETGEIGELELAGPHAAAGYWGDSGEGEETFADGWVSTGDLARRDEDGFYHIEGRKKNMFISGGENVYPPEVEDEIADHPAVAEVLVIGVPDDQWGTVGKAVVEPAEDAETEDGTPLTLRELEAYLDGRLARFKIPKYLEFVDEMPTSGPSKLDRAAVKDRFGGEPE
ncbi:long-chain fatty acid--CoA ligase [Halobiforma lacisalsi AJ5]|uniref:Long-chain fatty acid--CoA ligase n=1 Tax=Natronobacterium lacisalsi AJ5 TaxID=358396 RepID=M0LCB5_NATLA|nr:AMP-binding protein [Halobiforma lacisalsi]APW99111.1 long-chain fatty acid--CoA ligase [Halobiforma lacisalsi AJ5]EMA31231.1 long-chain fatty-acid-CoA ligase [Halobiforma lacisalsi AJ5]